MTSRSMTGTIRGVRARRIASWLGRAVLLASLAILFFATALVRGFL
jgi:hypothetical protein